MVERWFVVGTDSRGRFLLDNKVIGSRMWVIGSRMWNLIADGVRIGLVVGDFCNCFSFTTREAATVALATVRRSGTHLAKSARILRVRVWSKGERAKLACDWAGIPTLENGKTISTGRRVELLAERAMGLGATVHQQRAKLLDLDTKLDLAGRAVERNKPAPGVVEAALKRSKQPRKRPTQRGNRS